MKHKVGGVCTTVLATAVLLALGLAAPARADNTQILLLGGTTKSITFQGTASSSIDLLQLGSCGGGSCSWVEAGKGSLSYGQNQLTGYSGLWSLSIPYSESTYNLTLTNNGSNDWSVTQPSAITFDFGNAGCSGSGCYLTGNLQLTDIIQEGSGGVFNLGLTANLTITGGSLAPVVGAQNLYDYSIDFASNKSLGKLGNGGTLQATGSSGEVLSPTPEPVSALLLSSGLGLMLLGSGLRRHLQKAHSL